MTSARILALTLMLCIAQSAKISQQSTLSVFLQQDDSAVTPDAETITDSTDKDSVLNFVQSDAELQSDDAEGTEKEQNAFVQDDSTSGDVSASDDTTEKGGFLQLIN